MGFCLSKPTTVTPEIINNESLIEASRIGDLDKVIEFLQNGANPNWEEHYGVHVILTYIIS